jgi:hypothetical protein
MVMVVVVFYYLHALCISHYQLTFWQNDKVRE